MPKMKTSTIEEVSSVQLPTPDMDFNFDPETNILSFSGKIDFNYDDSAIIVRYGRVPKDDNGNPTGEPKPVTSRIFGKGKDIFAKMSDPDGNPMYLDLKLRADTKEALAQNVANEDDEKE